MSGTAHPSADPAGAVITTAFALADSIGVDRAVVTSIAVSCGVDTAGHELAASQSQESLPAGSSSSVRLVPVGWDLGRIHEGSEPTADRKERGAFYTPLPLVTGLTRLALDDRVARIPRVCDPMCGAGGFLLAAAEHLRSDGVSADDIGPNLTGFDVDQTAVMTARIALALWLAAAGADPSTPTIVVGDAIHGEEPAEVGDGFDVIIGNPPFLGQLRSRTARSKDDRLALDGARGYADAATIAWDRSRGWLRQSGRMTMVLPRSVLSARDAATARDETTARVVGMWIDDGDVFDANVKVVAPLVVSEPVTSVFPVPLFSGLDVQHVGFTTSTTWSGMLADSQGVPTLDVATSGTVSDLAHVSADFRQWFYDVAAIVGESNADDDLDRDRDEQGVGIEQGVGQDPGDNARENAGEMGSATGAHVTDAGPVRVITSGLIDPNRDLWGKVATKIGGKSWNRPSVTRAQLGNLGQADRLRPKVLAASQTKVIEAVVDEHGSAVGLTPVITATPHAADDVWRLAAVLLSPVASVWARRLAAGSGLSRETVRLSTTVVGSVPLPSASPDAWDAAAQVLAVGAAAASETSARDMLLESALLMQAAYGTTDDEIFDWWKTQLPRIR